MSHYGRHDTKPLRPGWKSVVLVCKACEKRGSGPRKLHAKDVGRAIGRACRDAKVPKPRIVLTSCLGACPKKAMTVAATPPGGAATMIAFRRGDDPASAVARLFPPAGRSVAAGLSAEA